MLTTLAKRADHNHICSMLTKTELQERRASFAADAAKAMAEYLAEPEAVRLRTVRLRALRLEREAADALIEAAEKAEKAAAVKKKAAAVKKKLLKPRKRVLAPASLAH